jgi:YD repeat-containing protein
MAWKRTKFDKGGKVLELETFVGGTLPAPFGSNSISSGKITTEYDAEFSTVTDQALKKRRSGVDGLGRLVRVDEPDAGGDLGVTTAPVQPTNYTYNALDNLIQTSQTGTPNGGSGAVTQTRIFEYSSLERLISAKNPESNMIQFTYEYDANGNLMKKTDARGIFINYTYDELNRNRTADYSNTTVNPDITRAYDGALNGKGKLLHTYAGGYETSDTDEEYFEIGAYDKLGRPLNFQQWFKTGNTWTGPYTTSQTYDLAGHVKTKTYPSGRSVTYNYDVAGDLTSFTGNIGDGTPRTYSTGIQYNPQGQLTHEQFGTSTAPLYHRRHYNSRGQLFDVRLGTDGNAINDGPNPGQWSGASWNRGKLQMFFSSNQVEYLWPAQAPNHNNGNLYRQDHFVPTAVDGSGNPTTHAASVDYYGYDSLSRVTLAVEETYYSGGGYTPNVFRQDFSYDRFGNRLVSSATGTGVPNPGFKINGTNNRLIAPTDANGDETSNDCKRAREFELR